MIFAEATSRIDVHVLAILLFLAPPCLFALPLNFALLLIFAVPQLRILAHAYGCYSERQQNPISYLVQNEIVLGLVMVLCWAVGSLVA